MGPVVSEIQFNKIQTLIQKGIDEEEEKTIKLEEVNTSLEWTWAEEACI